MASRAIHFNHYPPSPVGHRHALDLGEQRLARMQAQRVPAFTGDAGQQPDLTRCAKPEQHQHLTGAGRLGRHNAGGQDIQYAAAAGLL